MTKKDHKVLFHVSICYLSKLCMWVDHTAVFAVMMTLFVVSALNVCYISMSNVWIANRVIEEYYTKHEETVVLYIEYKKNISYQKLLFVTCILPIYMTVYALRAYHVISIPDQIVCFVLLSFFIKIVFTSVVLYNTIDQIYQENRIQTAVSANKEQVMKVFLRNTLHDVRLPINTILLGTQYLLQSAEETAAKRVPPVEPSPSLSRTDEIIYPQTSSKDSIDTLNMIEESIHFMNETLNNVLILQKIEDQKSTIENVVFDWIKLFEKILKIMHYQLVEKQITVVIDTDNWNHTMVYSDQYKIEHIFVNLLSNAIKFSPKSSTIRIEYDVESGSNHTPKNAYLPVTRSFFLQGIFEIRQQKLLQSVKDHSNTSSKGARENLFMNRYTIRIVDYGVGMNAQQQKKLFKPFSQIDANQHQQGGGLGIGLNLVKQMVDMLHGTIQVESMQNKGSTFIVSLPLKCVNIPSSAESSYRNSGDIHLRGTQVPPREPRFPLRPSLAGNPGSPKGTHGSL